MKTEAKIISLLRELRAEGKTMLVSTHFSLSHDILRLYGHGQRHRPASGPTDTTFTAENLELAFSGVLRHVTLNGSEESIITDDEHLLLWHIDRQRCRGSKMNVLLEPFSYEYMLNAMWVSAMVGGLCAFLSCYLMLKAGR